ncbi:MAG: PGF-pre-PGF domain-containing protein, partial [Thermoproteota archaeon]
STNEQFIVTDSVMASLSLSMSESFAVIDTVDGSAILTRSIQESLVVTDSPGNALAVTMSELMGIDEAFANISIQYFRTFSETLIIPADMCTSTTSTSLCDQTESDIIVISDDVVLVLQSPNNVSEEMSLADQLVRGIIASGRSPSESLQTNDKIMILLTRPPPPPPPAITTMPNLMMTSTQDVQDIADPAVAVPVGGVWAIDGLDNESLESVLDAMDMPIYNVSMEASSDGVDDMTMILPTFLVSAEIGGEASDDEIFLTPTVSDLPAGMGIMIPIDVQASISGNDNNLDALGNMTFSFTPAEDAGNFTMMIAMLDSNPEGGPAVPDDAIAFFLDVSFAGNFTGATPANSTYFEELPQITFTIDEEWLVENNIRFNRINLYLLDETTGEWVEIPDLDQPASAVNGTYTYTATLPHFSTFAISGTEGLTGGGGSKDREFTRSLIESLSVRSIVRLIEGQESSGRVVIKDLDESLAFSITQQKPLHQRVLAVHNVTIAVSVEGVRTATIGTAVATLYFEITNKGTSPEEIVLSYWYSIGGEREYEHQQTVTVSGGESTIQAVDIPFGSAGVYEIMIQAEARDQTLATTDVVVEVPWLAANLYTLIMIAAAVVAASIAYVAYAMWTRLHKL